MTPDYESMLAQLRDRLAKVSAAIAAMESLREFRRAHGLV
jgi:hypothetical protein